MLIAQYISSPSHSVVNITPEEIILWVKTIRGFGVTKFPEPLGWVGMFPAKGTRKSKIKTYRSSKGGAFGKDAKPPGC